MINDFINRQIVRARLLGRVPRQCAVHPDDVERVGDIGAIAIVADARVPRGKAWITE